MDDLSKIIKNLSDKSLLFGKGKRRKAIEKLGKIGSADVVPYLTKSLSDPDIDIKRAAFSELLNLKDENAINCLCSLYLKDRDKKIWEIITSKGFTPSGNKERLIFLIKTGQAAKCIPPKEQDIPSLIEMLKDEKLSKDSIRILSSINDNNLQEVIFNILFLNLDPSLFGFLINTGWLPQNEGKRLIFYLFLKRNEDALFIEKRKSGAFIIGYKSLEKEGKKALLSILFKNLELSNLLHSLIAFENELETLRSILKAIFENNRKESLLFFLKTKNEDIIINIMSSLPLSFKYLLEIGLEKGGYVLCMVYTLLKKGGFKADSPLVLEFMEYVGKIVNEILRVNIEALSTKNKRAAVSILSKIRDEGVVDSLIPIFKEGDVRTKRLVSNCLVAISQDKVLNCLIELFKEEDWPLRVICAETLGRLGQQKVIDFLQKGALEEKWGVCEEAFISLAKLSSSLSQDVFIKALRSNNTKIRKIASSSLGKIGDNLAIKPLMRALDDRDEIVRLHASHSIANISKRYNLAIPINEKGLHAKQGIIKAIGLKRDEQSINFLLRSLNDNDWKVRRGAIKSLKMIGNREFINPLIKMLQDEKFEVKRETAKALAILGEEKGFGLLIEGLKSKNWRVQMEMAYIMSNYITENKERTLKMLAEMTKDQNPQNRAASIIGLGMMKDEKFVPTLLMAWTQERELGIKKRIITSLVNIGSLKGERAFILGLADKEQEIRTISAEAFGKLRIKEGFGRLLENIDSLSEKGRIAGFLSLRQIIDEFGMEIPPKNLVLLDKKIKELQDIKKEAPEVTEILLLKLSLGLLKYKMKVKGGETPLK